MRVREALCLEREAHARTRQQFEEFKRLVVKPSGVDETVRADMDRPSSTVPSMGTILEETTDTDTPKQSVSGTGEATASDEAIGVASALPIAKWVRNSPYMRQPSMW